MTIGFTNGIALLIASTQIKDFLGLKTGDVPSAFIPRMAVLARAHWHDALAGTWPFPSRLWPIIIFLPRITRRIPGSILALLGCTIFVALFDASDRDHRKQVRRNSGGFSEAFHPRIQTRPGAAVISLGA